MSAHAKICRSRSMKKPFKVVIIGENGEPLMTPQLLTTRLNCRKNLLAVMEAFNGNEILVKDFSSGKQEVYFLESSGISSPVK